MGGISLSHWLIFAFIALIFFGPKRLPAAGKAMGEAFRGFKGALDGKFEPQPEETAQAQPQPRVEAQVRS